MAAVFPRQSHTRNGQFSAWVLADFCLSPQYRTLGPALQLQRACLEGVDAGAAAFCYDFPSTAMMAVYQRLGIRSVRQMVRLAKPLRVDRKAREIVTGALAQRIVAGAGNLLLRLGDMSGTAKHGVSVALHTGDCGEEFSALSDKMAGCYGICTNRSGDYLNWRYLDNPLYCYELLTARRGGELLGYIVFNQSGEDAMLADIFGVDEPLMIECLLNGATAILRERGVVTVSAALIESHPWIPLFSRAGFKAREKSPIIAYAPSHSHAFDFSNWFLTYGDRDS